jgi:hypothetical protein
MKDRITIEERDVAFSRPYRAAEDLAGSVLHDLFGVNADIRKNRSRPVLQCFTGPTLRVVHAAAKGFPRFELWLGNDSQSKIPLRWTTGWRASPGDWHVFDIGRSGQRRTARRLSTGMTLQEIKQAMQGEWVSIAPEVRPSAIKTPDGSIKRST